MREVWVVAKLREGCEDLDRAAGVWAVSLDQTLAPDMAVGAALDVFHNKVAIAELEEFNISAIDPVTREPIHESADYVQGSGCLGSVHLLARDLADVTTPLPSVSDVSKPAGKHR